MQQGNRPAAARRTLEHVERRPEKRYFYMLDAMRGIAALGVVCLHLHDLLSPFAVPRGYLAVDFFFGLSGLVISNAYGRRFAQGLSIARFMRLRLERLYPLYILGTLIGAVPLLLPYILHPGIPAPRLALAVSASSALLMLPSPLALGAKAWLMPMNVAAWSLFLELVVNLLFALVWRGLNAWVLASVIALSGAALIALAMHYGSLDLGATWSTMPAGMVRTCFSFFCGVAIGRLSRAVPHKRNWSVLLPVILFATLAADRRLGAGYDLGCAMVLYPALLYLGARFESAHLSGLRFLGNISYPIYALHSGLVFLAGGLALKLASHSAVPRQVLALVIIGGLIGFSALAEARFDRPLRELLARRRHVRSDAGRGTVSAAPAS